MLESAIEVDSRPGEYTKVRIVLPRTAAFITESTQTDGGNCQVLNRLAQMSLTGHLAELGDVRGRVGFWGETDPNFFHRPRERGVGSQRCGSVFIRARGQPWLGAPGTYRPLRLFESGFKPKFTSTFYGLAATVSSKGA